MCMSSYAWKNITMFRGSKRSKRILEMTKQDKHDIVEDTTVPKYRYNKCKWAYVSFCVVFFFNYYCVLIVFKTLSRKLWSCVVCKLWVWTIRNKNYLVSIIWFHFPLNTSLARLVTVRINQCDSGFICPLTFFVFFFHFHQQNPRRSNHMMPWGFYNTMVIVN